MINVMTWIQRATLR